MILDSGSLVIMQDSVHMLWSWMPIIGFYGILGKDFHTLEEIK